MHRHLNSCFNKAKEGRHLLKHGYQLFGALGDIEGTAREKKKLLKNGHNPKYTTKNNNNKLQHTIV